MFTQNQVRQFYVANGYQSSVGNLANPGDITVDVNGNDLYFVFKNADGETLRTDRIDLNKIMSVTFTPAEAQRRVTRATLVTLDSAVIDSSNVVSGEDYILNIRINQLNWHSDYNWGYKFGAVHSVSNMTPSDFYKKMAMSIANNMSRDPQQLLKVYLADDDFKGEFSASGSYTSGDVVTYEGQLYTFNATHTTSAWDASDVDLSTASAVTEVTGKTVEASLNGTYTAIILDEALQPWRLGMTTQEPVFYEACSDNVYVDGEEVKWGVETTITGLTTITDTKKIADMEWFYHGERGDIYRDAAWPNNWPNTMLTNMTAEYDTIDIHYYWNGANHAVQKSEKDITIACKAASNHTIADSILDLIVSSAGLTLTDLTTQSSKSLNASNIVPATVWF